MYNNPLKNVSVTINILGTKNTYKYNTTLGNVFVNSNYNPINICSTLLSGDPSFFSLPDIKRIISLIESQGYYEIINEIVGVSIKIKTED